MKIATQLLVSAGGIGPNAATADLEATKTIIATQITGTIWIEASADGVNFLRVLRMDASNEIQNVTVAATQMRVVADDATANASSIYVIAEQGRIRAGVIPPPVMNGPGPSIDVGSFGSLMSFYVGPLHETIGPIDTSSPSDVGEASRSAAPYPPLPPRPRPDFPGDTPPVRGDDLNEPIPAISLQISADGTHWLYLKTLHLAQYFTEEIRGRYFRVVAHGLTGAIAFASEEPVNVARAFVFRPGGVEDRNVFTDWSALVTAMSSVEGRKMLEFDDSMAPITAPSTVPSCVIPAGTWPMKDVVWSGYAPRSNPFAFRVVVDISEGAVFTNLRMIGGQITVRNNAMTKSPISDFGSPVGDADQIQIGMRDDAGNPQLQNLGAVPMFALGSVSVKFFVQNCLLGVGSRTPLIGHTGGICTLMLLGQNQTGPKLVAGALGATVQFFVLSSSASIGSDQTTITNVGGKCLIKPLGRIQRELVPRPPSPPAVASQVIDLPNALVLCNGTTALTQILPKIVGGYTVLGQAMDTGGQEIVVAEVSGGGKLKVGPAGGDTIDGLPNAVAIAPHGSRTFISDGEKNWITISVVS